MSEYTVQGVKFTDEDVTDMNDVELYCTGSNPHNCHPFILHDHGFVVCVVIAATLQDALDEACDEGKLDAFLIEEEHNTPGVKGRDASDYPTLGTDEEEGISRLGNASEPFDIEGLSIIETNMPKLSLCDLMRGQNIG